MTGNQQKLNEKTKNHKIIAENQRKVREKLPSIKQKKTKKKKKKKKKLS